MGNIFTEFTDIKNWNMHLVRNGSNGTNGLGLCFCKTLAERMGGTVGFSSVVGEGSEFWVKFPAQVINSPIVTVSIGTISPSPEPQI